MDVPIDIKKEILLKLDPCSAYNKTITEKGWYSMGHDQELIKKLALKHKLPFVKSLYKLCHYQKNLKYYFDAVVLFDDARVLENVIFQNKINNTFFIVMIEKGKYDIIKSLLKNERINPAELNFALSAAIAHNRMRIFQLLLEDKRFDPTVEENNALRIAFKEGKINYAELLLKDERVDPSADDNHLIRYVSRYGYLEGAKLLLKDKRVDPATNNNYPIRWTSKMGYIDIVKLLLKDERIDPSDTDNFAIKNAYDGKYSEIVQLLLQDERVYNSLSDSDKIKYSTI